MNYVHESKCWQQKPVCVCVCVCKLIGCPYLNVPSGLVHIVTVSMAVSLLISPTTPTQIQRFQCFSFPSSLITAIILLQNITL